ncbi:hypothetical protein CAEBREN_12423 [Caenorhabditis brenneri]|uniref:Uncharacterized protein n=1 Tax=Caenorhabditis brenneri TaxID=135651 RepID=G0MG32_CAEBE|nr:hypothetical protein CAEBREN_12423 [Caenorhabditis brenneri]
MWSLFPWLLLASQHATIVADEDVVDRSIKVLADLYSTNNQFNFFDGMESKAGSVFDAMLPIAKMIGEANNTEHLLSDRQFIENSLLSFFQPDILEYKQLMKFEHETRYIWEGLANETLLLTRQFSRTMLGDEDYNRVKLITLVAKLTYDCEEAITPTEAKEIAEQRFNWYQVLSRLNVGGDRMKILKLTRQYFLEFRAILKSSSSKKDILNENFKVFERRFGSDEEHIEHFFKELKLKGGVENVKAVEEKCLLRTLLIKAGYNNRIVSDWIARLRHQLMQLSSVLAVCSEINGTPESDKTNLMEQVSLISRHAGKYLNDSFESAWPWEHYVIFKEKLQYFLKMPGVLDEKYMEVIAISVREELERIGDPNYIYQMAAITKPTENFQFWYSGPQKYCAWNNTFHGFELVLGRIPIGPKPLRTLDRMAYMNHNRKLADEWRKSVEHNME